MRSVYSVLSYFRKSHVTLPMFAVLELPFGDEGLAALVLALSPPRAGRCAVAADSSG